MKKQKTRQPNSKKNNPIFDRVVSVMDVSTIRARCLQSTPDIMKGNEFIYIDNGSSILTVAHADTVFPKCKTFEIITLEDNPYIFSPNLDDRLGVYTVLDLLPALQVHTDILITQDEESAQSTAALFQTKKQYNWIVEFDRRGKGCVTYQYYNPKWLKALERFFVNHIGSYSDICDLEDIGVSAVNVAIGYQDEHTIECRANLLTYCNQIASFLQFYNQYKDTHFKHTPRAPRYSGKVDTTQVSNRISTVYEKDPKWYDDWDDIGIGEIVQPIDGVDCELCQGKQATIRMSDGLLICDDCNKRYYNLCDVCGMDYGFYTDDGLWLCYNCHKTITSK